MKDIHDKETMDMASLERSFQKYPSIQVPRHQEWWIEQNARERIERYLYEKPYLLQALRRRGK